MRHFILKSVLFGALLLGVIGVAIAIHYWLRGLDQTLVVALAFGGLALMMVSAVAIVVSEPIDRARGLSDPMRGT